MSNPYRGSKSRRTVQGTHHMSSHHSSSPQASPYAMHQEQRNHLPSEQQLSQHAYGQYPTSEVANTSTFSTTLGYPYSDIYSNATASDSRGAVTYALETPVSAGYHHPTNTFHSSYQIPEDYTTSTQNYEQIQGSSNAQLNYDNANSAYATPRGYPDAAQSLNSHALDYNVYNNSLSGHDLTTPALGHAYQNNLNYASQNLSDISTPQQYANPPQGAYATSSIYYDNARASDNPYQTYGSTSQNLDNAAHSYYGHSSSSSFQHSTGNSAFGGQVLTNAASTAAPPTSVQMERQAPVIPAQPPVVNVPFPPELGGNSRSTYPLLNGHHIAGISPGRLVCACGAHFTGETKNQKANFRRHLFALSGQYQCTTCGRMLNRGDNLQVHMRTFHPDSASMSSSG